MLRKKVTASLALPAGRAPETERDLPAQMIAIMLEQT